MRTRRCGEVKERHSFPRPERCARLISRCLPDSNLFDQSSRVAYKLAIQRHVYVVKTIQNQIRIKSSNPRIIVFPGLLFISSIPARFVSTLRVLLMTTKNNPCID